MSTRLADFPLETIFSAMYDGQQSYRELIGDIPIADLYKITEDVFETIQACIAEADDQAVNFVPKEAETDEDGWTLSKVISHLTATIEECTALSSMLARGIEAATEVRLRHEVPWQTIQDKQALEARLQESRKMSLASFQTWPDQPHLDLLVGIPGHDAMGPINAIGTSMLGLFHAQTHIEQIREIIRQASV